MTPNTPSPLKLSEDDPEPDSPRLTLDIDVRDVRWQPLVAIFETQSAVVWAQLGMPMAEVSLVLADDAELKRLNQKYRDKPDATNVLSFPALDFADPPHPTDIAALRFALLGDIIMSYDRLSAEATAANKDFEAHSVHLFVHGLLHLLGHDHQGAADTKAMESLETQLLVAAGYDAPYQEVGR